MRASPSQGFKVLIAGDPDPGGWSLHVSLAQALGELGFHCLFVPSKGRLSEQQRADCARISTLSVIEPGLDPDPDPRRIWSPTLALCPPPDGTITGA